MAPNATLSEHEEASLAPQSARSPANLAGDTTIPGDESRKDGNFEVDMSKPLVFQVGHLGERYDDWVHKAVVSKEGPRLFKSDFMESLTNTYWWMIPTIWLPVVLYAEREALKNGISPAAIPGYMLGGLVIWSLVEYTLHRFLFHARTSTYWTNTLHYLLHGCHHKHPQDRYRLVFPPALCVVFSVAVVAPFTLMFSYPSLMAIYGGGLLGYVTYDITHFWLHFGVPPKWPVLYKLRRYHLGHHFKNQEAGYGITPTAAVWDYVFGTVPPSVVKSKGS